MLQIILENSVIIDTKSTPYMAKIAKWAFIPHASKALQLQLQGKSTRDIADGLNKEFAKDNLSFNAMTVSRMIFKLTEELDHDAELKKQYDAWMQEQSSPKALLFVKEIKDGKQVWTSPFEEGRHFLTEKGTKKSLNDMVTALNAIFIDLGRIPPSRWTYPQVKSYLDHLPKKDSSFSKCVMIRNLLPQEFGKGGKHPILTDQYKKSINERVKTYDLFTDEVEQVLTNIRNQGFWYVELLHRLHLILGCREGTVTHERDMHRNENGKGGLLGLLWKNVNWKDRTIDVFEGKVKGGILWRSCPLDNFGWDIVPTLQKLRTYKGEFTLPTIRVTENSKTEVKDVTIKIEPSETEIVNLTYRELTFIYKFVDSVYKQIHGQSRKFDVIVPHTARHLHCNLLFERGVSSTVICGDAVRGEGFVGVGWTDKTTMETYYLSLVRRTIQKFIDQAKKQHGDFRPFEFKGADE